MKKIIKSILLVALLGKLGGLKDIAVSTNAIISKEETVNEQVTEVGVLKDDLSLRAKSAYLMDYGTQTVMYSQNEKAHLPIASMCKIMTLILSFEAIDEGYLTMDEEIQISDRAASMGGSQVFLEANASYPVKELIKSIVVCSANDSCVAMAEKIAGNESLFVDKMNEKAKALGANDTLFANCTGLPKEPQYSCAKDVALMLKELLSHEEYYEFGKVWLDKFAHPEGRYTEITNTNKLIRFYEGCDGGKTGFTNEAGFCLAATAKRQNMRVISVVIGEESSNNRFEDVKTMFNYAFANYTAAPLVEANVALNEKVTVNGGKRKTLSVYSEKETYALCKKGEKGNYSTSVQVEEVSAPIKKGDEVGELIVFKDGTEIDRLTLYANEDIQRANFLDRIKEIAENWNK